MIIFGFRRTVATMAMLTLACRNGHTAAHRLVKATRWFTLFFIPLIPFSRTYFTVCAQCGTQVEWSKADAVAAASAPVHSMPVDTDPVAPPMRSALGGQSPSLDLPAAALQSMPPPGGPPAGWYPEPTGGAGQRYWSGSQWTNDVQQDS